MLLFTMLIIFWRRSNLVLPILGTTLARIQPVHPVLARLQCIVQVYLWEECMLVFKLLIPSWQGSNLTSVYLREGLEGHTRVQLVDLLSAREQSWVQSAPILGTIHNPRVYLLISYWQCNMKRLSSGHKGFYHAMIVKLSTVSSPAWIFHSSGSP